MRPAGQEPWQAGERELRARLHDELAAIRPPLAPVDAVLTRGQAVRHRRRLTATAGLAGLAAVAAVLATTAPATGPSHGGPGITINVPDPRAPGGVFASGTTAGHAWQLAVRDIADPGAACLPAVLLDGGDGDVLARSSAGPVPVIGNVALLARDPGQPAAGFGFVQVRPGVTRVVVAQLDHRGAPEVIRPVTVARCGQHFRLAGFAFPAQGVRRITAYLPSGRHASYTPPPGTFSPGVLPPGFYSAGLWSNAGAGSGVAAAGRVASGRIGQLTWTVSVTLGGEGQCFLGAFSSGQAQSGGIAASAESSPSGHGIPAPAEDARSGHGIARAEGTASRHGIAGADADRPAPAGAGRVSRSSVECQPPQPASRGAGLSWLPVDALMNRRITGFAGIVGARTAYVVATGADGTVRRLTPAVIGGRKYFALVIPSGSRVVRLTLYDTAGRALASTALFPATG